MIYRDSYYYLPMSVDDCMDSCVRQSIIIMASPCDPLEKIRIRRYEKDGYGYRHPELPHANNKWNFTSDQLAMLIAGLHAIGDVKAIRRLFWKHFFRLGFCQNFQRDVKGTYKFPWPHKMKGGDPKDNGKWRMFDFADLLSPSRWGMMVIGGELKWLYWTLPLCLWVHYKNINFTARSTHDEMNQLIAECSLYNSFDEFIERVTDWKSRSKHYWSVRGEAEYHYMIEKYVAEYLRVWG